MIDISEIKTILEQLHNNYCESVKYWKNKYPPNKEERKREGEYPYCIWHEKTLKNQFLNLCVKNHLVALDKICLEFSFPITQSAQSYFSRLINAKWLNRINQIYKEIGTEKYDLVFLNYSEDSDYLLDLAVEFKFFRLKQSYTTTDKLKTVKTPLYQINKDYDKLNALVKYGLVSKNKILIVVFDLYYDHRKQTGKSINNYEERTWDIKKDPKYSDILYYFPAYI